CSQNAGDQRHGNNQVQPLFHHFTVNTGGLDQDEGQDCTEDQFPDTFHPQMHNPPPEVLVHDQRHGVVESEHPEHTQADQTGDQDHVDHGLATFEHGHQDIEDVAYDDQRNTNLGDCRLLKELPAHGREILVAS